MSLIDKPFDQLSEADFQELIENQVPESKTLDYKVELKFADRDKREFLADVSSFANTAGGYLLIGIKEEGGVPTALPGMELEDPDATKLKLISLLRDSTEPRIPGISIVTVPLQNSRYIIAIHIQKSWAAPHVVSFDWRFYARHSGGKYKLDVPELRQAFLMSDTLAEKIRRFHIERAGEIISGEVPLPLAKGPKFIIHIVPVDAFGSGQKVDVTMLPEKGIPLAPLGGSWDKRRYNLDGFLAYNEEETTAGKVVPGYMQLFRSGAVECVCIDIPRTIEDGTTLSITYYERQMLHFLTNALQSLKLLQVEPPYSLMVTMAGVKNIRLHLVDRYYSHRNRHFDRDVLQLPDVLIQSPDQDSDQIMRPIFDAIWNAAGWEMCQSYNELGKWTGYV